MQWKMFRFIRKNYKKVVQKFLVSLCRKNVDILRKCERRPIFQEFNLKMKNFKVD